jgi:hypothetical protein
MSGVEHTHDEVELLEAAARERWGESWFLEERRWADGDRQVRAIHSRGRADDGDGPMRRDELWWDSDREEVVGLRTEVEQSREVVGRLDD